MIFNSITFVMVFLPIFFIGYFLLYFTLRRRTIVAPLCNAFLFLVSLIFYFWGEPHYFSILLVSIAVNFFVALLVRPEGPWLRESPLGRKLLLSLGIAINLIMLGYFKYMNFFIDNGGLTLANLLLPRSLTLSAVADITLPMGISFYTFEGISYIVDAYRGNVPTTRSLVNFGCYLTMFPHLVAGPIVRYTDILGCITRRRIALTDVVNGAQRFILGLAKKVLIADTLGNVADAAFSIPGSQLSALAGWAGIVCYTLQIYYDFSGYSDMAIGLAQMMGFTFPENFRYPYIARSCQEFWRRWHMTLSSWFRDYLYIPLGGSRRGTWHTILNLLIVFITCGFWHGAQWTFLAWGLYHGLFLSLERVFKNVLERLPAPIQHIYAIAMFMGGWILFRSRDFSQAWSYFKALFGAFPSGLETNKVWILLFSGDVYLALVFGILFSMPTIKWLQEKCAELDKFFLRSATGVLSCLRLCAVLVLFVICMFPLVKSEICCKLASTHPPAIPA